MDEQGKTPTKMTEKITLNKGKNAQNPSTITLGAISEHYS